VIDFTVALCERGVYTWGGNKCGQLGLGDTHPRSRPVALEALSEIKVSGAAAGAQHTLLLTQTGRVFTCGNNSHGQLSNIGTQSSHMVVPTLLAVPDGIEVVQVAAGQAHSVFLSHAVREFTSPRVS
jgi:alpha-tubulin suppressor-like RCC1 family protein